VVWNIEKHAPHKKPPTPDESSSRQIKEIGENEPNERQEEEEKIKGSWVEMGGGGGEYNVVVYKTTTVRRRDEGPRL
jgi:hypothetical protein